MEITRRRSGRWIALPSWKHPSRPPGLFAPFVTINFQGSPRPSRRIRSFSSWTTARMRLRIFRRAAGRIRCRASWGSCQRGRSTEMTSFSAKLKMCPALIATLVVFAPGAAQDRLAADLARYEQETDVVRKARALVKLGDDQIDEARKQLKGGD